MLTHDWIPDYTVDYDRFVCVKCGQTTDCATTPCPGNEVTKRLDEYDDMATLIRRNVMLITTMAGYRERNDNRPPASRA